jgi:hypothetical protein
VKTKDKFYKYKEKQERNPFKEEQFIRLTEINKQPQNSLLFKQAAAELPNQPSASI